MSLEADLLALMTESVTVEPFAAHDAYGTPTYTGIVSTYPARVSRMPKLVRDGTGREVVARHTVYLGTATTSMTVLDRLLLPGGARAQILSVEPHRDETGAVHHVRVRCG